MTWKVSLASGFRGWPISRSRFRFTFSIIRFWTSSLLSWKQRIKQINCFLHLRVDFVYYLLLKSNIIIKAKMKIWWLSKPKVIPKSYNLICLCILNVVPNIVTNVAIKVVPNFVHNVVPKFVPNVVPNIFPKVPSHHYIYSYSLICRRIPNVVSDVSVVSVVERDQEKDEGVQRKIVRRHCRRKRRRWRNWKHRP